MAKNLLLCLDDSGTRNPDRANPHTSANWFALGGHLLREEDETKGRDIVNSFCGAWGIGHPLHSADIRRRQKKFYWLAQLNRENPELFEHFNEKYLNLLLEFPGLCHGCVINRPGYDKRYKAKHKGDRWMMCQTAFAVLLDRGAKLAARESRGLKIYLEKGDDTADNLIRAYLEDILKNGLPFDHKTSQKYKPINVDTLRDVFQELKIKEKTSPLIQMADLYLYPICRGKYHPDYSGFKFLADNSKLIDQCLPDRDREELGIKYSCFDPGTY